MRPLPYLGSSNQMSHAYDRSAVKGSRRGEWCSKAAGSDVTSTRSLASQAAIGGTGRVHSPGSGDAHPARCTDHGVQERRAGGAVRRSRLVEQGRSDEMVLGWGGELPAAGHGILGG